MPPVLVPYLPTSFSLSYEWRTDVLPPPGADETRIACWSHPQVTVNITYDLIGDFDLVRQSVRARLFSDPQVTYEIPLRHEGIRAQASVTDENVELVVADGPDWLVAGLRVYVEQNEDEAGYAATIVSVGLDGVVLDETPAAPTSAEATRVYPLVVVQPMSSPTLGRHRVVEGGKWTLTGTIQTFYDQGTAASADRYLGDLLWDRPALQDADEEIAEAFDRNLETFGMPLTEARSLVESSRIRRDLSFSAGTNLSEWLWYKQVMFELLGQQGAFWRPTFRPDLRLHFQPVSATTFLIVKDSPDYRSWYGRGSHDHLELTHDDGSIDYVHVDEDPFDNLDGTLTLPLDGPYTPGGRTIEQISFLERTRLGADVVTVTHTNGNLFLNFVTLVGPWT